MDSKKISPTEERRAAASRYAKEHNRFRKQVDLHRRLWYNMKRTNREFPRGVEETLYVLLSYDSVK